MIFKNLFILFLLNYTSIVFSENVLKPIFRFIIANEPICGDPFTDPLWLPALEDCQIDCDISSQLCQERTDKGFPGQRCTNLPIPCRDKIKEMLNLDPDIPALQLPLAPLTAAPTVSSFKQELEEDEGKMPGQEPQMPIAVPPTTTDSSQSFNLLQPPVSKSFRDPQHLGASPPAYEPMPPSINSFSDYQQIASPAPIPQATPYYVSTTEGPQIAENYPVTTAMPPEYEDERNIDIPDVGETSGGGDYRVKTDNIDSTSYDVTASPSYLMSMMSPNTAKQKSPWSWTDLEQRLKHRPFYSVDQAGTIEDYSLSCCQWALDGLCDRSWQRVRQLCPKSCGTVVCTSVDGGLSCNRAIDVDVLDCFQRRRFYMLHAAPINYQPQSYRTVDQDYNLQKRKQAEQDSTLFRAYAIENEIKGFGTNYK